MIFKGGAGGSGMGGPGGPGPHGGPVPRGPGYGGQYGGQYGVSGQVYCLDIVPFGHPITCRHYFWRRDIKKCLQFKGDEYNYSQQQGGAQHGNGRPGGWGGYTQQ